MCERVYIKVHQIHPAMPDRTFSKPIYAVEPSGQNGKVVRIMICMSHSRNVAHLEIHSLVLPYFKNMHPVLIKLMLA